MNRPILRKVPQITVFFWIIKLLTTGMGEVTSDFLARQFNPILAVAIGGAGLGAALILQFSVRKYVAAIYWLTVVMVAIFGTMIADVLHVGLGIPYIVSTGIFSLALCCIFLIWFKTEKTLSVHSITSYRREFFYWATVMTSFALGTAVGDLTANTFGLGFFISGILFAALIAIPAIGYWKFHWNEVVTFWLAYILTRPLGASFADWAGRPQALGGLDVGTGEVSLVLTILIVILVGYMTVSQLDNQN